MTRKRRVEAENIVDAALAIVREGGYSALSVRNVASYMKVSTMPVYSSFENMEMLEQALAERVKTIHLDYQGRNYTENPLLDMSVGSILFAQEEPNLFRFLYFDWPGFLSDEAKEGILRRNDSAPFSEAAHEAGKGASISEHFSEENADMLGPVALKGWIFTHGLATMAYSDLLPRMSVEEIAKLVNEAGQAFYLYHTKVKAE